MADIAIDKVRASRDGHQYHEAWLARRALGLLLPRDGLCGIAVEGLSVEDQEGVDAATVEIADATFYFGTSSNFHDAEKIEIAQFKYSIGRASANFTASDATKTLSKFAKTESGFLSDAGQMSVAEKVSYAIYTNRPIGFELVEAISALANGTVPSERITRAQYDQLLLAIPLDTDQRRVFATKINLLGQGGDLRSIEKENLRIIADWSASKDALARARLGGLRQLVRGKAGHAGQKNNLITNIDVLAELEIAHESDLLPTPYAFAEPGPIVEREQLKNFIECLDASILWIVHAAGGVGKTVFVQSVASRLSAIDEVVIFDCFGGGAYRSPLDVRHRPERGLMHIVNELACRGLCDPILPGASDPAEVARRSIQRFMQVIEVLRRTRPKARLILIIDAADNAAMEARDRGQASFPQMLLESLSHLPQPIDGLVCIATARTERRDLAIGRSKCADFVLEAFSAAESRSFIEQRRPEATPAQIEAIHGRSNGNPRVMANLIEPDRALIEIDTIESKINLDDLIRQRIDRAFRLANDKGSTGDEIAAFLCALSVLPPPVPINEMGVAFAIPVSEVESFAADLSPLLERTRHGLIFRDEPTETLVRETYGQKLSLLDGVVSRLRDAQASSIYAARSLPGLLFAMGRTDLLRSLAFETRFPSELASELARRAIRLNRLRTAVGAAAKDRDFSATVDLLVELAALVIVDERGEDYLLDQPDLVVGLGDPEGMRRLFEVRTGWPGTRHSRLAIAYVADGDAAGALGHAARADDWHRWYHAQDEETKSGSGPDYNDYASIAFYIFARGGVNHLTRYVNRWKPFYGFTIAHRLFEHCAAAEALGNLPNFTETLRLITTQRRAAPALIVAAATAFPGLVTRSQTKPLMRKIARGLKGAADLPDDSLDSRHTVTYRKALMRCAIRMANLRMTGEADRTLLVAAPRRYHIWSLRDTWQAEKLVPFALGVAARCVSEARTVDLFDCLPQELWALVEDAPRPPTDEAQRLLLNERLSELRQTSAEATVEIEERRKRSALSVSEQSQASDRLSRGIIPLLAIVRVVSAIIRAEDINRSTAETSAFFESWEGSQSGARMRGTVDLEQQSFENIIYMGCAIEIFETLDLLSPNAADRLLHRFENSRSLMPEVVIDFVGRLAVRQDCHTYAGRMATLAVRLIDGEDDVQRRSQLFARLSRALLQANRSEAALIFKRGLDELDAIGSGDGDFAHELLNFAASLRDGHLRPALALRLAKICEMNVYDSDKWHWSLTARAFARASGSGYLAQIARWHDRDKVNLNLTLPSALTHLVKDGGLHPATAVSLLWLVDPQRIWNWSWGDLVKALREQNASPAVFNDVLDQFEHSLPGRSSSYYISELRDAFSTEYSAETAVGRRIDSFERRNILARKIDIERRSTETDSVYRRDVQQEDTDYKSMLENALLEVDPTEISSFERFVETLKNIPRRYCNRLEAYGVIRAGVAYADRAKHVEAIVFSRNIEFLEKNEILKSIKTEWMQESPTQLAFLSGFGIRLAREHAEELLGRKWGFTSDLVKLSEVTGTPTDELVMTLVEAATTRELDAAAMTWLSIATILSNKADAAASRVALERLLDGGAARLADEVGDGPWNDRLDPGTNSDEIAAGLLWFGLGSPTTTDRWRAAHAVRSAARHGRWGVIEQIFSRFDAPDAGAFQDRSLPFYKYHAQLWSLIAIARIAQDHPAEITRFRFRLEAIAFDGDFPHVGLREAACQALLHCIAGTRDADSRRLRAKIEKIHVSKFPLRKRSGKRGRDLPRERPKDHPEPKPPFHFDYDFEKNDLDSLAMVFGLPKWHVGDLCHRWIRNWSPSAISTSDLSGRRGPYSQRGYHSSSDEAFQSHGTYLAWHATAVVGGQLLLERPVTDESYYDDPWQNWLAEYRITRKDGYWISDGTDHYPALALNDLRSGTNPDHDRDPPINDQSFLRGLTGLGEPSSKEILTQGWWTSPDNVSCSVMSALVDLESAEFAALAVATSPRAQMWLPHYDLHSEEHPRSRHDGMEPCEPWITHIRQSENLDERDPFGAASALSIYRPARSIITRFGLREVKPWSHLWTEIGGSTSFRYHAWGGWRGEGDHEDRESGYALHCDRIFLSRLLSDLRSNLIVLVKLQRYLEARRFGEINTEKNTFVYSSLVGILDSKLDFRVVEPTPTQIAALLKLSEYDIHDFSARLRTIERSK
jgi:hypothetical protein